MFAVFKITRDDKRPVLAGTANTRKAAIIRMAENLQRDLRNYVLEEALHDPVPSIAMLTEKDHTDGAVGDVEWFLRKDDGTCGADFDIDPGYTSYEIFEVSNAKYTVVKADMLGRIFIIGQTDDKSQADLMLYDQVLQKMRDYYLNHVHTSERVPGMESKLGLSECSQKDLDDLIEIYRNKLALQGPGPYDDPEEDVYFSICELPD